MNTVLGMFGNDLKMCLNCRQKPAFQPYDFCGKICADWAKLNPPAVADWPKSNPPAAAPPAPSQPPKPPVMVDPTNPGPFRGDSWEECSTFIQSVRNVAWKEGKIRDLGWMADFASIHFSGKALAWYSRLPWDVQEDWSKLQKALVTQWSTSGDQAGPQKVPDAASAQSAMGNGKMSWSDYGILRATMEGSVTTYYVWRPSEDGDFSLTENASQAARFRFDSTSSSKLLEYVDGSWYSWLAIHWRQSSPNVGRGSVNYADLSVVDSETMKSSRSNDGPFQLAMCKVSQSNEVTFVWRNGSTETAMTIFHNGSGLFPVPDAKAYKAKYRSETRVRLFLETVQL